MEAVFSLPVRVRGTKEGMKAARNGKINVEGETKRRGRGSGIEDQGKR